MAITNCIELWSSEHESASGHVETWDRGTLHDDGPSVILKTEDGTMNFINGRRSEQKVAYKVSKKELADWIRANGEVVKSL